MRLSCFVVVSSLVVGLSCAAADQPTVEQFKQVFDRQLQELKPQGYTERTVLFQDVRPGRANGGHYAFEVTATIHDYGPGYPTNRFYGATCVGKMDKWTFDMLKDPVGKWLVQGRMTVRDSVCKDNPSEGVSAMPVASLTGDRVGRASAADSRSTPPAAKNAASLYVGEYACYGTGGRLMAGMGFHLKAGGAYNDGDGRRGGTYGYDTSRATISFRGGFLDGQTGRNVQSSGFELSATVRCEPWV